MFCSLFPSENFFACLMLCGSLAFSLCLSSLSLSAFALECFPLSSILPCSFLSLYYFSLVHPFSHTIVLSPAAFSFTPTHIPPQTANYVTTVTGSALPSTSNMSLQAYPGPCVSGGGYPISNSGTAADGSWITSVTPGGGLTPGPYFACVEFPNIGIVVFLCVSL